MSILGLFFLISGIGGLSRSAQAFLTTGEFRQISIFVSLTMIILGLSRIKAKEEREKDRIDAKKYRESLAADTILRGKRPSPSTSATSVNVGTVMRGGNGKLWVCRTYNRSGKRIKRWVLS
ncbi:MAG: hypothetical protein CMB47_06930 [Euryarchaeota archaeon]|nr:hypothetical protein [Euryarchaeota archaeon]|tara:strand:- start:1255 stop:1617 length:363 start_codon:yes stop_codon:yes gene_type:complete